MGRGRRRWTAEEKRRIVEQTRAPGASVSVVARRHDLNANLLFKWKRLEEADEPARPLLEGPEFVPIGVVGGPDDGGPALLTGLPALPMVIGGMDRASQCGHRSSRAAAA